MNSTTASITIELSRPDLNVLADALGALAARKDTTMPFRTFANGLATRLQVFEEYSEAWEFYQNIDQEMVLMKSNIKSIWRTKEGKTVRVCDMDGGHLLNCIRLTERMAKGEEMIAQILTLALMSFKPSLRLLETVQAFDKRPPPIMPDIYWDLRKEAEFRGIPLARAKGRMANVEAGEVAPPAPLSRAFDFS